MTAPLKARGPFTIGISQRLVGALAAVSAIVVVAFVVTSVLGGSDDSAAVSVPAASTAASGGIASDAASTPAASTPAVVAASTDPADHWVVTGHEALSDAEDDLWIVLSFANPWGDEPPTDGFVSAGQISAGLELDGRFYGTLWSNSTGIGSYAEALAGGAEFPRTSQQQPLVEPELWVTDEGKLAIRFPGPGEGSRMPAALLSTELSLLVGGQTWTSFGADPIGTIDGIPLGPIGGGGNLPRSGWQVAVPDLDTITLSIPDTSGSE